MINSFYMNLKDITPSQLYISEVKLKAVNSWFSPVEIDRYEPLPIKNLNGTILFTDGHTRALFSYLSGIEEIKVYWDEDELDWDAYNECVKWCKEEKLSWIGDLAERIITHEAYQKLWLDRCQQMQEHLKIERTKEHPMKTTLTIKTKRLEIKPYEDSDQTAMIELLTHEDIKKTFMIPDFQTEDEAIAMFHKLKDYSYSKVHFERGIYLNQTLIGFVNDVGISDGSIELGYVIHPEHSNKGYATEMFSAVIEDLFQKGFREIVAGAFEENAASFKVMEKCGMKKMPKEEDITYRGNTHHCYYYSIAQA